MHSPGRNLRKKGSSLVEAVIAVGVLAVAIPLVFAALAESGKSGTSSEAETRSTWMVPVCLDEIRASREGRSQYFSTTKVNQPFPASGAIWALGFSLDGKPVGKIEKAGYDKGEREIDGTTIGYIASMSSAEVEESDDRKDAPKMMRVLVSLEYPATAPADRRTKLEFYTRVP